MKVSECAGHGLNRLERGWFRQPGFKKRRPLFGNGRRKSHRKKNKLFGG